MTINEVLKSIQQLKSEGSSPALIATIDAALQSLYQVEGPTKVGQVAYLEETYILTLQNQGTDEQEIQRRVRGLIKIVTERQIPSEHVSGYLRHLESMLKV